MSVSAISSIFSCTSSGKRLKQAGSHFKYAFAANQKQRFIFAFDQYLVFVFCEGKLLIIVMTEIGKPSRVAGIAFLVPFLGAKPLPQVLPESGVRLQRMVQQNQFIISVACRKRMQIFGQKLIRMAQINDFVSILTGEKKNASKLLQCPLIPENHVHILVELA